MSYMVEGLKERIVKRFLGETPVRKVTLIVTDMGPFFGKDNPDILVHSKSNAGARALSQLAGPENTTTIQVPADDLREHLSDEIKSGKITTESLLQGLSIERPLTAKWQPQKQTSEPNSST